jgi:hypothetical protein
MTLSVDDYEKAIARISDNQGHAIGTGFLVAPGYVLTCAHVVLQAIGITKEKFAEYEGQPQDCVSLDFHLLKSGSIQAKVVAWLPFSPKMESGDVAVLKLLTSEPSEAKPIPLVEVLRAEVEKDQHSIYGFGKSKFGGRSDAYRPKTTVAGGRFQLCKFGDPNDETIKPGFSGAPVWNEARQCIIGMVATAVVAKDEQQSTAYAIPTRELQPVLKQVDAFYLHDVLMLSLEACSSEGEKHRLEIAIDTTLQRCNPNGGERPWQVQLIDLSVDRAPTAGWESEGRLVHFAMILARMDDTPSHTYEKLKNWVEQRCNLSFPTLLDRITLEMKQQQVSSSSECQHLMVAVEPVETSMDELRVSLWAVPDRETYNPNNPPRPIVSEKVLPRQELPAFLREQIRQKLRKKPIPTIHLFVPRTLFGCDVEMLPSSKLGTVLGSEYPFVVRTNLKTHPIGYYYYDDWNEKWEQVEKAFENKTHEEVKPINCSLPEEDLIVELKTICAAMLEECESVGEFFELVSEETALPVVLWSRNSQFQSQMPNVLDCIVRNLPDRIRQERDTAWKSKVKPLLGHHLSLVWEDPKIVPPDMQFDPEAY